MSGEPVHWALVSLDGCAAALGTAILANWLWAARREFGRTPDELVRAMLFMAASAGAGLGAALASAGVAWFAVRLAGHPMALAETAGATSGALGAFLTWFAILPWWRTRLTRSSDPHKTVLGFFAAGPAAAALLLAAAVP